ncbi:uncharacterized protein LOC142346007 [Convolutriloba macropyga]|uniref:uncharacterized protein LOC142346007 n=1 Tax=Convolutriloba macropyga TaxID=536237 RepID=UPI003F524711
MTSSTQRRVLIAIDGSRNADYAFEYYCKHIHYSTDTLFLFHFMDPVSMSSDLEESLRELYDIKEAYMDGLQRIFVSKASKYHINKDRLHFHFTCDPPEPGKAICSAAKNSESHLVIMGCRGLSKLKKALIGSVSDHVIRHAGVPVLTVPYAHHK